MTIYIQSAASIWPGSLPASQTVWQNALHCADPDLTGTVDPKQSRRMSHVIKMGIAAAMQTLQQAGVDEPDALVIGTAYGCLEDTGIFLKKQVLQKETMLTPTAFIQSTHNTVGGQIGLLLHCHGYNNTIVHRGFSFDHAMLDATMLLQNGDAQKVLAGGLDEMTNFSHAILSRFGLYKSSPTSAHGTIAGEGAAFFLLSAEAKASHWAKIIATSTLFKPQNHSLVVAHLLAFLANNNLTPLDIAVVFSGSNGHPADDEVYCEVKKAIFPMVPFIAFKQDLGEYPTATAHGLYCAATYAKSNKGKSNTYLLFNHYQNIYHSFMLLATV